MTTKTPRIYVTLSESDADCVMLLAKKWHISASNLIRKMVEDCLEKYEDEQLAMRAIEAEKDWIANGSKTISHEEIWETIDTQ